MISDWELWACAQRVVRDHGAGAVDHIGLRLAEMAKAGDEEGVRTWTAIVDRAGQLADFTGGGKA